MDINFIYYIFLSFSVVITFFGILDLYVQAYLPVTFTRTFRYGKYGVKTYQPIVEKLEIPKKWFKHFYVFATPLSTCCFILCLYKYVLNGTVPETVYSLLDISLGSSRKALVSPEYTFLAMMLLTIHCWKRLHETCNISIFSDKKMNITHYIVAYVHYIGAIFCIIGESDGFVRGSTGLIAFHKLTLLDKACAILFLWSTFQQLRSNLILRNLRKTDDKIVSEGYKVPHGGLFDYISAPLQFTEILIYLTLSIILWESSTFHYATLWVVSNQIICAVQTHRWYQETFKNYPKNRKILIPYLY